MYTYKDVQDGSLGKLRRRRCTEQQRWEKYMHFPKSTLSYPEAEICEKTSLLGLTCKRTGVPSNAHICSTSARGFYQSFNVRDKLKKHDMKMYCTAYCIYEREKVKRERERGGEAFSLKMYLPTNFSPLTSTH